MYRAVHNSYDHTTKINPFWALENYIRHHFYTLKRNQNQKNRENNEMCVSPLMNLPPKCNRYFFEQKEGLDK